MKKFKAKMWPLVLLTTAIMVLLFTVGTSYVLNIVVTTNNNEKKSYDFLATKLASMFEESMEKQEKTLRHFASYLKYNPDDTFFDNPILLNLIKEGVGFTEMYHLGLDSRGFSAQRTFVDFSSYDFVEKACNSEDVVTFRMVDVGTKMPYVMQAFAIRENGKPTAVLLGKNFFDLSDYEISEFEKENNVFLVFDEDGQVVLSSSRNYYDKTYDELGDYGDFFDSQMQFIDSDEATIEEMFEETLGVIPHIYNSKEQYLWFERGIESNGYKIVIGNLNNTMFNELTRVTIRVWIGLLAVFLE